ncbi:SAM-dependent methyltransferase [Streptomyces sp. NPDC057798]|uniref:SAM-dependent methyltransferase n=1 Tax=Streptomyces sp. NPDC057798 TaxID=3346252 RepID=UPI003684F064
MSIVAPSFARLQELVADEPRRIKDNHEMVTTYYALVNDLYRAGWGESHHFPPLHAGETLAAAATRTEQELADRAGLTAGSTALDIGCGVGGPALTIARHSGAHVTGIDLSPVRIACAKERAADAPVFFLEADACRLPLADCSFDACYSLEAICHVPDKQRVHEEALRVLRPGGWYVGRDWLAADGLTTARYTQSVEPVCRLHGIPALDSPRTLRYRLEQAGFTGVQVTAGEDGPDMERTWDLLEESLGYAAGIDDPLVSFMAKGGAALVAAARSGDFLIGSWSARKT